jgi:DNA-binding GntR family transcriptional regulator
MNSKTDIPQQASLFAYKAIKEMIAQYKLIPGQKITYDQLARALKISKTPIINALYRLEQEEFVISVPNRGFFIKEIGIQEIEELYKIREALETLAVEAGIRNQTPDMLREVEKARLAHKEYNLSTPTRDRLILDAVFHLKIATLGGNHSLVKMLRQIFEQIYLRHRIEGLLIERLSKSKDEHQKLFHAIKGKDIKTAKKLIRSHIRAGKNSTIKGVQLKVKNVSLET